MHTNAHIWINFFMIKLLLLNICSDRLFPPCPFSHLFHFSYLLPAWKKKMIFHSVTPTVTCSDLQFSEDMFKTPDEIVLFLYVV